MAWSKIGLGVRLLIAALVIYAAAVVLLVSFGDETSRGGAETETSEIADAAVRAANLITTSDQVISMLFTITVGVIVGVGFVLRDRDFRVGLGSPVQLGLAIVFALAVISAVYFGYTARMHAVVIARGSFISYEVIDEFIARQAFAVVVAAGAALALFALYIADKHPAPAVAPVVDAPTPRTKRSSTRKPSPSAADNR
jgi:hypothetical protein